MTGYVNVYLYCNNNYCRPNRTAIVSLLYWLFQKFSSQIKPVSNRNKFMVLKVYSLIKRFGYERCLQFIFESIIGMS